MGDAASASAGLRATVGKGNRVRTGRRHVPRSFLGPRWRARPVTLSHITTSLGVLTPPATRLIGWGGVARGGRGRALTRRHMDIFLEAGAETQFFFFFFFLVPAARDHAPLVGQYAIAGDVLVAAPGRMWPVTESTVPGRARPGCPQRAGAELAAKGASSLNGLARRAEGQPTQHGQGDPGRAWVHCFFGNPKLITCVCASARTSSMVGHVGTTASSCARSLIPRGGGRHDFCHRPAMDGAGRTAVNLTPNPHPWRAGDACVCTKHAFL